MWLLHRCRKRVLMREKRLEVRRWLRSVKKAAPAEQDAEHAQAIETCGQFQEPGSKELVEQAPQHDGKAKANRRVPKQYRFVNVQEVVEVPTPKAKAKARGRPTCYVTTSIVSIDEGPNAVDDRRNIKHEERDLNITPDTITHLIAYKRRQALENTQNQIPAHFSRSV